MYIYVNDFACWYSKSNPVLFMEIYMTDQLEEVLKQCVSLQTILELETKPDQNGFFFVVYCLYVSHTQTYVTITKNGHRRSIPRTELRQIIKK
ncbi:MAG: hypothetical protein A3D44_02460 [Candidatus Staskawiczbacteria bacterium RIFCSPHIGHO2_02_FULL_42_22]|uniref:Uncharacterized protein n=1 Tax=Candidatus Staskawiczbacteria bacterium RIFCSPHIGHO2_02_FULL_42_22 TaxID=1802207 RepID=A0A1G2HZ90_9BACT|nr:MAG: hypothetical protein A3D44_02460 [Candidatus Staskawiczbacteria bacterium RIFCSPHIGHO2_02_FULL_42_22]